MHEERAMAEEMAELDISTVGEFDVFYHRLSSHTSTPKKKNYQSITDPMVLDKIDIVSDSESSLSSDGQFILAIIDDIDCIDLPSSQSKVDEHLKQVHQQHPHVLPVEPGKVYKMDKILDNIQDQPEASDDKNQSQQNTQHRPKRI